MKTNAPNKTLLAATCAVLLAGSNSAWAAWTNEYVRVDGSNTASGSPTSTFPISSGVYNTAHGYHALFSSTADGYKTAFGSYALSSNGGSSNDATGYRTLFNNQNHFNIATGAHALYNNVGGSTNTANGAAALYSNTDGVENTATGYRALFSNTTGTKNSALGLQALFYNTKGVENTATGVNALYNTNGDVCCYPFLIVTGSYNTAFGRSALATNVTGNSNIAIGYGADVASDNLTNATAIGYNAVVDASDKVRIGNANVQVIEGNASWSSTSDKRLKSNIADLPLGLDFISKLRPVEYIRNNNTEKTKEWGLIAQELQQTLKDVGYKDAGVVSEDKTPEKYLSVRYNDVMVSMIKSIQDLQKTTREKQKTTQEQQQIIAALLNRIEMLEKKAK